MGIRSTVRGFLSTVLLQKVLPGAQHVVQWGAEKVASRLRDGVDLSDKVYSPPGSAQGTAGGIPSRLEVTPPQPGEKKVPKIPTAESKVPSPMASPAEAAPTIPTATVGGALPHEAPAPTSTVQEKPDVKESMGHLFAPFERVWLQDGDTRFPGEIYACHDGSAVGSGRRYDVLISQADGSPRLLLDLDAQRLASRHRARFQAVP